MLEMPIGAAGARARPTIWEIDNLAELAGAPIATGSHTALAALQARGRAAAAPWLKGEALAMEKSPKSITSARSTW